MTDRSPVTRRGFLRGAAGTAALAGGAGTAAAQEDGGETHTVDMTDDLVFDPDTLTIAPGDTVVWENIGTIGHSVTAYEEDIPDDAEFFASGGFETEQDARGAYAAGDPDSGDVVGGESYEHTFEVLGTYEYFCIPHETVGMLGTITVQEGGGGDGGDGAAAGPVIPDAAKTIGLGLFLAMLATLGLAYSLLRYGGSPDESAE